MFTLQGRFAFAQEETVPAAQETSDVIISDENLPSIDVAPVNAIPPQEENTENLYLEDSQSPPPQNNTSSASGVNYVERSGDSLIVVEFLLDDIILDEGLVAYAVDETILVPLSTFTRALDFQINVDAGKGIAQGWFIDEAQTFSLSAPFNNVVIGGKARRNIGIVEAHRDEIYVSIETLADWFPLQLTMNYGELRLYMKTDVPLPFQERAARRAKWKSSQNNNSSAGLNFDEENIIELPAQIFSPPLLEFSHGLNLNSTDNNHIVRSTHGLNAQGDLLRMDTRLNVMYTTSNADAEEINNIRFNMKKEDYRGRLLGPLKATQVELGDISSPSFPLAGGGQTGRGITIENTPYNFVRDPENFIVEGFAPIGWDVEVYQDQRLLQFGTVDNNGRYEFRDIDLREGFNLFRIVLYGPNGEREERFERFFLGQNMVDPGKFLYQISALQSATPLLDVSTDQATETEPVFSAFGEYGLTNFLSLQGGYFHGPRGNATLDGLSTGIRASSERVYSQLNAYWDKSGGKSSSLDIRSSLGQDISLSMGHKLNLDYPVGIFSNKRESYANISKSFDFFSLQNNSITFETRSERSELGQHEIKYINRISTSFLGLSLRNTLEYKDNRTANAQTLLGDLTLRKNTPIGTLRGTLNYNAKDTFELNAADFSLQSDISKTLSLNSGIALQLGSTESVRLSAGVDWRQDKFRLGVNGAVDDNKNFQVGTNLTYYLLPQNLEGYYFLTGKTGDINSGRLFIQPFIDDNNNGTMEADEELLEDISFRNLLRGGRAQQNAGALAVITDLTPNIVNKIRLDSKTLPDIYMKPAAETINVMGKSGVRGPIGYPVLRTGAIRGYLLRPIFGGENEPLADTLIYIVNSNGEKIAERYTEYDGYFSFEDLSMGVYDILLPPQEIISPYYTGDGKGPSFTLSPIQTDNGEPEILVLPGRIILADNYTAEEQASLHGFGLTFQQVEPASGKTAKTQ